jgi:hypothetical protein
MIEKFDGEKGKKICFKRCEKCNEIIACWEEDRRGKILYVVFDYSGEHYCPLYSHRAS